MTRVVLPARSIGSTAAGILRTSANGTVVATFARACYLDLGGTIVAVVAPDLLNGPLNVVVTAPAAFSFEQLTAGQTVRISPHALDIGDRIRVDTTGTPVWPARLRAVARRDARTLGARVAALEAILTEAPEESLARAERRPWRAAEAMSVLAEGLRRRNARMVREAAGRLAGLGPGLTPSGDDVLAGAMLALTLVRSPQPPRLREVILRAAAERTTRVSGAYLQAASRGEAGEAWHALRDALAPQTAGPGALDSAARRVMAFGETSGADMLAGFVLGLRALMAA